LALALALSRTLSAAEPAGFVTPVAIDQLVQNPADFFDLEGKTVRFTPSVDGSYKVETIAGTHLVLCNRLLKNEDATGPDYAKSWSVVIPFSFPFGEKHWNHLHVNLNGNISFEQPESVYWPDRDPWADGGMCSVAAALDSRSTAGFEKMIAVFWDHYQLPSVSRMSFRANRRFVAITWNVTRAAWGQAVLGENTFQARLYASGAIEFAYPKIAERDGIVGLFTGKKVTGKQLSHWTFKGKAEHSSVDIDSADVYDAGSVLDLAITMKHDALTNVESGPLDYRCWMNHDSMDDMVSVSVSDEESMACWLGAAPLTGGWRIDGKRVDMFVSKVLLAGCRTCSVAWDVTLWGKPGRAAGSGSAVPAFDMSSIPPATIKLSKANETHTGNIFEVFHYPVVTKASERLLEKIYKRISPRDDIAIVFTDFRIDDLYAQGNGAIAANLAIEGIGNGNAHPRSTEQIGSTNLQVSIATVWLGAPIFDETGTLDDGTKWFNFAHGVKWLAHECTHRWGMDLSFVNPTTGKQEKLTSDVGHWLEALDTTTLFPISDMFLDHKVIGGSIMGGHSWHENADHTYSASDLSFLIPAGFSGLDLYVMGLLPPEKVPPTFILEDFKNLEWNKFQGTSRRVEIKDIVAAMGERKPPSADAQKVFRMKFYVAHEPGHEADPAMMERARKFSAVVADFFSRASGGAMQIIPSASIEAGQNSQIQKKGKRRSRRHLNTPAT
jgi:hypothetical protein